MNYKIQHKTVWFPCGDRSGIITCTYTTKIIIIASGGCSLGMQYVHSSCFEHKFCCKAVLHYIFGFPEEMLFQKAKAR